VRVNRITYNLEAVLIRSDTEMVAGPSNHLEISAREDDVERAESGMDLINHEWNRANLTTRSPDDTQWPGPLFKRRRCSLNRCRWFLYGASFHPLLVLQWAREQQHST
jgi:hypothetical protein